MGLYHHFQTAIVSKFDEDHVVQNLGAYKITILCIFFVLIIFYIYQTIHSFPDKFRSLPTKFWKCF